MACPHFPANRTTAFAPSPVLLEHSAEEKVYKAKLWNGDDVWLVTGFDEARQILSDHESFSQKPQPGYPSFSAGRKSIVEGERSTFLRMDPPEHTRLRKMLTSEFMVKRINAMTPDLEAIVDDLIDKVIAKGNRADIVKDLAYPYPTRVIMKLLGLPEEDIKFVSAKTTDRTRSDGEAAKSALDDLIRYMREETAKKMHRLDEVDDLMTRVLKTFVVPGEIDIEDAVQMFELIAVGGHETTANMTALGILALLENPDQADLLRKQPELMPSAVNEMLRYISIAQHLGGRVCVKDRVIGGKQIKAGEGVYALLHMANWDAAVFDCPAKLDVERNPTNHLAFSFGAHQCLGMNLARLELQIVYRKVLERLPNLKLERPASELEYNHDTTNFGIKNLPVTF